MRKNGSVRCQVTDGAQAILMRRRFIVQEREPDPGVLHLEPTLEPIKESLVGDDDDFGQSVQHAEATHDVRESRRSSHLEQSLRDISGERIHARRITRGSCASHNPRPGRTPSRDPRATCVDHGSKSRTNSRFVSEYGILDHAALAIA